MYGKASAVIMDIKDKVDRGLLLAGSKLPSTDSLAKTYGIAYPTAHKAIRRLVDMGYLYRRQGDGTYVAKQIAPRSLKAGLVMRTEGHLFGAMVHHLLNDLQEAGYSSQIIPFGDGSMSLSTRTALEQLISSNPSVIISEHRDNRDFLELMDRARSSGITIIWLLCNELPGGQSGNEVSYDAFSAYYQLASHLVGLGHRRIGIFALSAFVLGSHPAIHAIDTIKKKYGDVEIVPFVSEGYDEEQDINLLKEGLDRPDRPTAVICSLDYRATLVVKAADMLGLKVPEDLSVTGFFDTPWAATYKLTTVNVYSHEISAGVIKIIEQIESGTKSRLSHRVLVEPELVIRLSTGPVPKMAEIVTANE